MKPKDEHSKEALDHLLGLSEKLPAEAKASYDQLLKMKFVGTLTKDKKALGWQAIQARIAAGEDQKLVELPTAARPKWIVPVLAAAAVMIVVAASQFLPGNNQHVAKISSINGTILTADGQTHTADSELVGKYLTIGETIRVGKQSSLELHVKQSGIIYFGSGSRVTFEPQNEQEQDQIRLTHGSLAAVFAKRKNNMHILTAQHGVNITGTSIYMRIENKKQTYFCVCNGKVELLHSHAGDTIKTDAQATHHSAYRFTSLGSNDNEIEKAPMLYHMDPFLNELAKKIGSKIDWDKL